jgi:hypothetical protein
MVPCESCGVQNDLHDRFCAGCGKPRGGRLSLPQASRSLLQRGVVVVQGGLDWRWVILGTIVTLGICSITVVATIVLATPTAVRTFGDDDSGALTGFLVTVGCGFLLGFFLGGVMIGRLSKGRTIVEPAVSAVIATAALAAVLGAMDQGGAGVLCAAPILCVLAVAGAWLGEKWQGKSGRAPGR